MNKYTSYITKVFPGYSLSGNSLRVKCPHCGEGKKQQTLAFYPETNSCFCFRCEYTNSIFGFIQEYEGLNSFEVSELLHDMTGYYNSQKTLNKAPGEENSNKTLQYTLLKEKNDCGSRIKQKITNYLHSRKVTEDQILKYKIGYRFINGSWRIVFPIFDMGKIYQSFVERTLDGNYVFPKVKKSNLLYGIQYAKKFNTILICEGVFDVFALGENAIALLGKKLTKEQYLILKNLKRKYIVILDGDAWENTLEIANKLSKLHPKVLRLPKNKDPSDMENMEEYVFNNSFQYREYMRS